MCTIAELLVTLSVDRPAQFRISLLVRGCFIAIVAARDCLKKIQAFKTGGQNDQLDPDEVRIRAVAVYLSVGLSVCLSVCLCVRMYVCVCRSVGLSVCLFMSVSVSVCVGGCISPHLYL